MRPLTEFISNPNFFSFFVAYLAGTAGVLSLTSAKSGALIGVLISVTTIPAIANKGVATARRRTPDWAEGNVLFLRTSEGVVPARARDAPHSTTCRSHDGG